MIPAARTGSTPKAVTRSLRLSVGGANPPSQRCARASSPSLISNYRLSIDRRRSGAARRTLPGGTAHEQQRHERERYERQRPERPGRHRHRASRGIGKGLALHLAKSGATLVVTGRKSDRLANLSAELDTLGTPHIAQPLDQADREGALALAENTLNTFGRIDGLVANAQTFRSVTPLENVTPSDMDLLLDTGPKGVLWMMQAVFPAMREQGWGRIVTMGSNAALLGAAGYGPYAVAKEGIRALTRVAAREWGQHGILVNCIARCRWPTVRRPPTTSPGGRSSRPPSRTFPSVATASWKKTSRRSWRFCSQRAAAI